MSSGGEASGYAQLEAALLDAPDDDASWAVYADCLTAAGDPRGELITVELALEGDNRRPPAPALARRYAALMADAKRGSLGPALAARIARPDASRELALEWRRGHLHRARIDARCMTDAREALAAVHAAPCTHFLHELELSLLAEREPGTQLLGAQLAAGPLPGLRRLELDAWTFARARPEHDDLPLLELTLDWGQSFARLRELSVRSPRVRLASLVHPRLERLLLSMRHGFDPALIEALARARLPALRELHLFLGPLGSTRVGAAQALVHAAISNPRLAEGEGLRILSLYASELSPSFYAALAESPQLTGLIELRLAYSTIRDAHLPALRALFARAPQLQHVDLSRNYLSEAALSELRHQLGPRMLAPHQKPDLGTPQVPVFGRYGLDDREPPAAIAEL